MRYLVSLNRHMAEKYERDLLSWWEERRRADGGGASGRAKPEEGRRRVEEEGVRTSTRTAEGPVKNNSEKEGPLPSRRLLSAGISSSENLNKGSAPVDGVQLPREIPEKVSPDKYHPALSAASLHNHRFVEKRRRLVHVLPPFDGGEDKSIWPVNWTADPLPAWNTTAPGVVKGREFPPAPFYSLIDPYLLMQRAIVRPHCAYRYSSDMWGQDDPPVPSADYYVYEVVSPFAPRSSHQEPRRPPTLVPDHSSRFVSSTPRQHDASCVVVAGLAPLCFCVCGPRPPHVFENKQSRSR